MSMSRPEERFPATDRKVLRRLDETAIRQVSLGIAATLLSFVAIVWIGELWRSWPRVTVLFGGLLLAVGALQAVLIGFFENLYPRGPQRWRRRFSAGLLLRAVAWSAFLVFLLHIEEGGGLFYLAMFLPLALGSALAATWLADIWTVRLYLALSLLPPMISLLLDFSPESWLMAVFIGVFLYALVRTSENHYRLFWRALSRSDAAPVPLPVAGSVHARLLVRAAEEMRRPVATVSDALALEDDTDRAALQLAARRAAQQLVYRLEVMEDAAKFLRGERQPAVMAGGLRRRCEEAADDIGIVAADTGIRCTTRYDAELPERLRTDYELLFRGLRAVAVWALEQMPPGSELVLGFQLAAGQHEDRLRCAVDVRSLYLPESLRSGLDRTAQGSGIVDPDVPLPLAVAGEIARLLGGRLTLIGDTAAPVIALEVKLEVVDQAEQDNTLRSPLRGRNLLLVGGTEPLASSLDTELHALDMNLVRCDPEGDVMAAIGHHEPLLVVLDGFEPEKLVPVLKALRDGRNTRRVAILHGGAEQPELLEPVLRPPPEWLRMPVGRRRLRRLLTRVAGIAEEKTPDGGTLVPLRVLVVEDNHVNQMVARGMLEKLGCDVEVLPDGAVAVQRLERGGIDLVLMDGEMPGMDGSEATRRIRAREAEKNLPRLPIVAMTAHTGDAEIAGFLAAGMDDCIAKPVSLASLASRIDRFRQRR